AFADCTHQNRDWISAQQAGWRQESRDQLLLRQSAVGAMTASPDEKAGASTPRRALLRFLFWFIVFNTIVFSGIAIRYLSVSPLPAELGGRAFFALMCAGHLFLLAAVPLLPAFLAALVYPKRGLVLALAVIPSVALIFLFISDTFVFQLYRFHLNGAVFELLFG